jgi:molybdopterin molybdotransferase
MNMPKALLPLEDALAELKRFAQPQLGSERVNTFDVDDRVLREDVISEMNVPPFDNSAMDGYAVRAEDVQELGAVLKVTQRIAAGASGHAVVKGEAARIFTGAPVPPGATAVIAQEDCELEGESGVRVLTKAKVGHSIRVAGEDIAVGDAVLTSGLLMTPSRLGMAASLGREDLLVSRRPRVALFSTGDELVMPGEMAPQDMGIGKIFNSNRYFLKALLIRAGCLVTDMGNIADDRAATIHCLSQAAAEHDLILTSGGVSVGEEDHIKPSVQALGELHQWALAIKPGKPFAYGRLHTPKPNGAPYTHFIGLPGNPVSSYITFLLLVKPFLSYLQGATNAQYRHVPMKANFDWLKADKRREFLRVRQNADGALELFPNQSSGVLTSVVWGDGVVDNPPGQIIKVGDTVNYITFESWIR